MLQSLKLSGVGPAPEMAIDFAPRINVLTGDNGLGKSFLLDVAFWALAQKWPSLPAWPRPEADSARIEVGWDGYDSTGYIFRFAQQGWQALAGNTVRRDSIALYARNDSGFSVWDPYRSIPVSHRQPGPGSEPAVYNFDGREIWEGLQIDKISVCEGLERDWVRWQSESRSELLGLTDVLAALSPPGESLVLGTPMRVFLGEGFARPTLQTANGSVPVVMASAGVRRILAFAYLLVWTVSEHRIAATLTRRQPLDRLVVLIDEPETHLHPKWQRTILPSVLAAVSAMSDLHIQLVTATHSPLVLASLEPAFDPEQDQLTDLHLDGDRLKVEPVPWRRHGDVTAWLTSEIFDLKSGRSIEAEKAIEKAKALSEGPPDPEKARELDRELRGLLGETDPFWIRWRYLGEKQGWLE